MSTQPMQSQPEVHHLTLKPVALSPAELLQIALQHHAAIDVIERLTALCEKEREYQANVEFDEALNRCQAQLSRVSADAHNPQTNSRYASYAQLDRIVRPIYTAEDLSVSFGEKDCPTPGKTRFVAYLSRGGVTREYIKDMTASTKGPRGGDVMTQTHAEAALDSYAKRYLLKDIFNIAVGEDDDDGNCGRPTINAAATYTPMHPDRVRKLCFEIANSANIEQLRAFWQTAGNEAKKFNDRAALEAFMQAKDARKRELR